MFEESTYQVPWRLGISKGKAVAPYLGIGVGVVSCIGCLALLFRESIAPPVQAESGSICVNQVYAGAVTVYVSGAVNVPGVYTLSSGQRMAQAIELAGGVNKNANALYVQKELNLASELIDGQHIYVPLSQEVPVTTRDSTYSTSNNSTPVTKSLVSINTATQSELEALPKVGEKTVEKIIAGRPYTDLFQLVSTKVLSQSVYDEIREQLTL